MTYLFIALGVVYYVLSRYLCGYLIGVDIKQRGYEIPDDNNATVAVHVPLVGEVFIISFVLVFLTRIEVLSKISPVSWGVKRAKGD